MKKLNWKTEKRQVSTLLPRDDNPRTINDKQLHDLTKSLKKFNLVEIPAIDTDDTVLAGHQRLRVLKLLGRGDEEIDVRVPNRKLTNKEAEQYLISSNTLGGDWDFEKLKSFDLDMLLDIGFDQVDLSHLWDQELEVKDEDFDVEEELKKIKKPTTKLGDLIHLGPHRLICGNSLEDKTLQRLFGSDRASMIYSDPPYNINLNYSKGIGGKKNYGGNVNDDRTYEEYKTFIKGTLTTALSISKADSHIFYWCDQTYIGLIQELYRELSIRERIKAEVERFKKFELMLKGNSDSVKVHEVDIRNYAKLILNIGTSEEKREVITNIKSNISIKDKKLSLICVE